ncbi:MAG: SDR family NAD(P)-dependent oxidoreductase [Geodermatophilaceae bacterium]
MPRTVVLTGASSGIGAQAAAALARNGDHLVLLGRNPDKLAAVVAGIRATPGTDPDARSATPRYSPTYGVPDRRWPRTTPRSTSW